MASANHRPIICSVYANADQAFSHKLKQDLLPMAPGWLECTISTKAETAPILELLNAAQIILLWISPDLLASDACRIVIEHALDQHESLEGYAIPILLHPVSPQALPFGKLRPLPLNAQPVSMWRNRDDAWEHVLRGVFRVWIQDAKSSSLHPTGQLLPGLATSTLPFQRNPFFTGREELLTRLRHQLLTESRVSLTPPHSLGSFGGIGKTQIALEYAYRHRADYQSILWISAATRDSLTRMWQDTLPCQARLL